MSGWIKISRNITNHWIWQDAEKLRWWTDLLMMAAWEERKILVGKQMVTLRRGQMVASKAFLYQRWGRSKTMVYPFLKLLEEEKMIAITNEHRISIITITNYDKHQNTASDAAENATRDTVESAASDAASGAIGNPISDAASGAANKEYKEINKEKNIYRERPDFRKYRPCHSPAYTDAQTYDVNDLWQQKQGN